ncbi:hypothetical protein Tco_0750503 [Tanacetum coccineum]|uniref:Uncharacterized protein n=1 Tax=Tanacetum coccineum TaxID=301880 RepID=A0ABQ4Z485_9ASTR
MHHHEEKVPHHHEVKNHQLKYVSVVPWLLYYVHSEARFLEYSVLRILNEEAGRQLLEQAPRSPEYVPDPMELEDHVPVYIPEPEHPEDLVPAEDEAPTPLLPPFFLSPRIRPLSPRALEALEVTERRQDDPPLRCVNMRVITGSMFVVRESSEVSLRHLDPQTIVPGESEIEVLRRERLAYEQESIQTRQDLLAQLQIDLAVQHIMRTQALEAGARVDTLEDTGSSS